MKREVKIGIFAVAMIGVAWGGIRFLMGYDLLGSNAEYYASYDRINGVQSASPIMMKGVKIGSVTGISFDPARSDRVVLRFTIRKQYRIPEDSEAKIVSDGLLGGKAIEVTYGSSQHYLRSGDTLRSGRDRDLMDMAGSELDFMKQKVSRLTADLSTTLENLNALLEANAQNVTGTLGNLDALTGDMASLIAAEKEHLREAVAGLSRFSGMLGENAERVDSIIGNLNGVTAQLAEEQVVGKLGEAAGNLASLLDEIEHGDGTMARLLNDPALYDSLTVATGNLSALLADLKAYPARYVHLSLFGRDPEKMKARAEKRAARKAAKEAAGKESGE